MRRSLYRQLEDSLDIIMVVKGYGSVDRTQTPKSFTTAEGLMFFPIRTTGGKDKLRVSYGTPTIRNLVLSGLINREFEHHFATAQRSLLRSEMATLRSEGGSAKSSLVSST